VRICPRVVAGCGGEGRDADRDCFCRRTTATGRLGRDASASQQAPRLRTNDLRRHCHMSRRLGWRRRRRAWPLAIVERAEGSTLRHGGHFGGDVAQATSGVVVDLLIQHGRPKHKATSAGDGFLEAVAPTRRAVTHSHSPPHPTTPTTPQPRPPDPKERNEDKKNFFSVLTLGKRRGCSRL